MKIIAIALLLGSSVTAQAAENLKFHGTLVEDVCELVINNGNLAEVTFPALSAAELAKAPSAAQPFTMTLKNCYSTLSSKVRVTFTGTEATDASGLLALDNSSAASGVAIALETTTGTAVAINNTTGTTFTLQTGSNSLTMNARVKAIGGQQIVPGQFSASATATFEYL